MAEHSVIDCEAALYEHPEFDRFHCRPDRFVCSCGQVWQHVCDEAEGCEWVPADEGDKS